MVISPLYRAFFGHFGVFLGNIPPLSPSFFSFFVRPFVRVFSTSISKNHKKGVCVLGVQVVLNGGVFLGFGVCFGLCDISIYGLLCCQS